MNRKKEKNIEFYEVGEGRLKSKKKLTSIKKPSNSKSSFKVAGAPKMKFHFDQGHHPSAAAENVIQFVGESANSRSVNPSWPRVSAKPRQLDGSPGNWPSSACSTGIGSRPIASSATQSHSQVRETSVQSFSNQQMEDQHFSDGSDNDQEECWFEMITSGENESLDEQAIRLYSVELRRLGAIVPINKNHSELIVPGFLKESSRLSTSEYFIVRRKAVKMFLSGDTLDFSWLYYCSCSPGQMEFIKNLPEELLSTIDELENIHKTCQHCKVVAKIMEEFDEKHEICPSSDLSEIWTLDDSLDGKSIIAIPHDDSKVIVCADMGIGFVGIDMGKLKCLSCKYEATNCGHIVHLRNAVQSESADIPNVAYDLFMSNSESRQTRSFCLKNPISSCPIPYKLPIDVARKISVGYSQFLKNREGTFVLSSEEEKCGKCGSSLSLSNDVCSGPLLTMLNQLDCKVFSKECSKCGEMYPYDGGKDGILNMGTFLIGYDVLRDYMYHFVFGSSSTLISYYNSWKRQQLDYGNENFSKVCSYQDWRASWYAFLELLDIDYESASSCPECGVCPGIVVCDGTSLGFRKQLLSELAETEEQDQVIPRKSMYNNRLAIQDAETRKLFAQWVALVKKKKEEDIDRQDEEKLDVLLEQNCPKVLPILQWAKKNWNLPSVIDLFSCMSSCSPVCSYIPPTESCRKLLLMLANASIKSSASALFRLQQEIPLVYHIVVAIPEHGILEELLLLLQWLFEISCAPFKKSNEVCGPPLKSHTDRLAFFPTLPKYRERGHFAMDQNSKKGKDEDPCTKKSHGHPSLTSGIFTVYCPHGINYGFKVMETSESPNVPFTTFRTRFEQAPATIIYDNACNLHSYCLNRDPEFFKDTKFLVDRFHWRNHTGCCLAYNISQYPAYEAVNSQVNEQQNSTLKRLRSQLSYMGPEKFMMHCKFFLWFRNMEIHSKK